MSHDHPAPAGIVTLFDFVSGRITEAGGTASVHGDDAARRVHDHTLETLGRMREDLDADPQRADEVVRSLYRLASEYSDHPDFQPYWRLFDPM